MEISSIEQYLKNTNIEPSEENPNSMNIDTDSFQIQDIGAGRYKFSTANSEQISLIKGQFDRDETHPITINQRELYSKVITQAETELIIQLDSVDQSAEQLGETSMDG